MATFYMTVQGRSRDTTDAIVESAARLGVESSNPWCDDVTPSFIDFPFTDESATFADHLDVVREVEPDLTVAPDIEKGRTLAEVVDMADQLAAYADAVIVVPKTVKPSAVPDRFRIGVTCADYGTNAPHSIWAYRECGDLHILGGPPSVQLETLASIHALGGASCASVDTATLGKVSRFGYWDGGTVDAPDGWDYRRRLRESLDTYADVLSSLRD